jgi:hypothetical protein
MRDAVVVNYSEHSVIVFLDKITEVAYDAEDKKLTIYLDDEFEYREVITGDEADRVWSEILKRSNVI